jgi:hypothetical protein
MLEVIMFLKFVIKYLLHNLFLPDFVVSHQNLSLQNGFGNSWPNWRQSAPPPEPSMAQVLRQANLATLQHLAQITTTNNNNGGNGNDEPQSKLRDFQNSNPPTFSKSIEPLDADDWLQTIENKLEYAGVGPNDKVLYATHFLAGAAGAWRENVRAMQPEGQVMTWEADTSPTYL